MLEDVAMPHVQQLLARSRRRSRRQIEALDNSRDISGIRFDRVLACWPLVAFRWHGVPGEDKLAGLLIGLDVEWLAIKYLKLDKMNV